jgi:hypothetical protein
MSFLAASAFVRLGDRISVRGVAGLVAFTLVAAVLFPFVRWGNERQDWYSNEEIQAVHEMYRVAPRGSVLVGVSGSIPWRAQDYAAYEYRTLRGRRPATIATGPKVGADQFVDLDSRDPAVLVAQIKARMAPKKGHCAFLLATRAQDAALEMNGPFSAGAYRNVVDTMKGSGVFLELYSNRDAVLFSLGTCTPKGVR